MSHQAESDTYLQPYGGDGLIGTPPLETAPALRKGDAVLHPGDRRLLDDVGEIDDRGLEMAEALLHERRYRDDLTRTPHPDMDRALAALSQVRTLSKRG